MESNLLKRFSQWQNGLARLCIASEPVSLNSKIRCGQVKKLMVKNSSALVFRVELESLYHCDPDFKSLRRSFWQEGFAFAQVDVSNRIRL